MIHRSPILRFAIEIFLYALELQARRHERDRKLAVMHLAQVVELAVKAALVERNHQIFEKNGKTLGTHEAQEALSKAWGKPIHMRARIELLIDERNAIQHRYGNVDELTLDYHLETVIEFFRVLMKEDFDTDLDGMVRSAVPADILRSVRFIRSDEPAKEPSASVDADRPQLALLGGFATFERALRERTRSVAPEANIRSVLDLAMKFLGNVPDVPQTLLKTFPDVVRLRNSVAHGVHDPVSEEVKQALSVLDEALKVINRTEYDNTLRLAAEAHHKGRRGVASLDAGGPPPSLGVSGDVKPAHFLVEEVAPIGDADAGPATA